MTSEKQLRSNVLKILRKAGLDARPVENACDIGYPDVDYIGGSIELKAVKSWPKRASTPLVIEHYSQEQRIWHMRRSEKGGRIHLLLQVRSEYLLFEGNVAAHNLGNTSQPGLRALCCARFESLTHLRMGLPQALSPRETPT